MRMGREKVRISKDVISQTTKAFVGIDWTTDSEDELSTYVIAGESWPWIADKMGRTEGSVKTRWFHHARNKPANHGVIYRGGARKHPEKKEKDKSRGGR